jgi:hypothetical protein
VDNVQHLSVIIHAEERCAVINTYNPEVVLRPHERSVGLRVALSCVSCIKRPGVTIVQSLQWLSYGLDDGGIGVWFATSLRVPPHPQPADLLRRPLSLVFYKYLRSFLERQSDLWLFLFVTQVRNVWSCISTRPYVFIAKCLIKHTNVLNVTFYCSSLHGMHCSALTRVLRFPSAFESVLPRNIARISELSLFDSREFSALRKPTITQRGRWTILYWITL